MDIIKTAAQWSFPGRNVLAEKQDTEQEGISEFEIEHTSSIGLICVYIHPVD